MEQCRALSKASGSVLKKGAFASEQDQPDVARYRKRWQARQDSVDTGRLVFIDETWVKTNMAPLRGWGGEGLIGKAPHGRWRALTFLAVLRVDWIEAPCVFDGPINGERFRAYVEQFLVRTLRPGDIVVLDNLGSYKGKTVHQAIRNADAHRLFLPPYTPDLNPIEQVFAKPKHWLRQASARSFPDIYDNIANILGMVPLQECVAYFQNSEYASI
jgi:transposase